MLSSLTVQPGDHAKLCICHTGETLHLAAYRPVTLVFRIFSVKVRYLGNVGSWQDDNSKANIIYSVLRLVFPIGFTIFPRYVFLLRENAVFPPIAIFWEKRVICVWWKISSKNGADFKYGSSTVKIGADFGARILHAIFQFCTGKIATGKCKSKTLYLEVALQGLARRSNVRVEVG